jgi:hypothetical protein
MGRINIGFESIWAEETLVLSLYGQIKHWF